MTVRWGFLGAGAIARNALAPAVHAADGAVLQAVAARDPLRAAALEPVGQVHADYAALCDDPAVDAVYVALANDAHLPWSLRALEAGKHVLCEKPLALTAGQVRQLADAAAAADRLLVEAFWYRWHPRTRRAEALLAEGLLGDAPREVEAVFTFEGVAAGNYRLVVEHGGGALYDVGCYAVSAAHWALGPTGPLTVTAARREPSGGVDLTTVADLAGPAGTASVRASFAEPPRQVLACRAERAGFEFLDSAFASWHAPARLRVLADGTERVEEFEPVDPYRTMVEAVGARIAGDDAWVVPLADSLAVAATLDAVRAAAAGEEHR